MSKLFNKGSALALACVLSAGNVYSQIKTVLHYTKQGYFNHAAGVKGGTDALDALAAQYKFTVKHTNVPADLQKIKEYDLVVYNNNTEMGVPDENAKTLIKNHLLDGGKVLAIHAASDHKQVWDWWDQVAFNGLRFTGHGNGAFTVETDAELNNNAALKKVWSDFALGSFQNWDTEIYYFNKNIRGATGTKIFHKVTTGAVSEMKGDHIFGWTQTIGKGEMLYTALGHDNKDFAQNNQWLKKAMWAWMNYLVPPITDVKKAPAVLSSPIKIGGESISIDSPEKHSVEVLSTDGKKVFSKSAKGPALYNLPLLKQGIYIVKVTSGKNSIKKSILIK